VIFISNLQKSEVNTDDLSQPVKYEISTSWLLTIEAHS